MKTGPKIKYKQLYDKAFLEKELQSKTLRELAKVIDCDSSSIANACKRLSITVPKRLKYKLVVDKSEAVKAGLKKKYPDGRFGQLSSNWKGGPNKCIECGKNITRKDALRCRICSKIELYKDKTKHPNYIDGRTSLHMDIRNLRESKLWGLSVFKRDNFTCIKCGNKKNLEPNHKKPFSLIFKEFLAKYSKYNVVQDKVILLNLALIYKDFWDINNGETLCHSCHILTDTYGGKARKFK